MQNFKIDQNDSYHNKKQREGGFEKVTTKSISHSVKVTLVTMTEGEEVTWPCGSMLQTRAV